MSQTELIPDPDDGRLRYVGTTTLPRVDDPEVVAQVAARLAVAPDTGPLYRLNLTAKEAMHLLRALAEAIGKDMNRQERTP